MVVCPECGEPTRLGRKRLEDGRGVRVCKKLRRHLRLSAREARDMAKKDKDSEGGKAKAGGRRGDDRAARGRRPRTTCRACKQQLPGRGGAQAPARSSASTTSMAVPRIEKISLNMGVGEAIQNIKILDDAVEEMAALAGQRPTITRAQKSIAAFKLREGMPIGCPGDAARRPHVGVPRPADLASRCRACATSAACRRKSFDGRGNYTLGVRDHLIFPEIDYNKVEKSKGMNITIVTTAGNDERALFLLRELGMPFAQARGERRGDDREDREDPQEAEVRRCGSATAAASAAARAAIYRKFGLCRIYLRDLALQGYLPGVIKASW